MPARRLIPCLDVRAGKVVKGVQFRNHRVMGEIVDLACSYRDQQADELVFYDISASPEGRSVDVGWVERVARAIDIPFCVAGGIRSADTARRVLYAGADKISINTPALLNPNLINELAEEFGSQCIVIGVDSLYANDSYQVKQFTGDPDRMEDSRRLTESWVREVQERGAGEIVLNCMNQDGVRKGYDIQQLSTIRKICDVPLIASGGAGRISDFAAVFAQADVDGALAATVFHSGEIRIPDLKNHLSTTGIEVRHAG